MAKAMTIDRINRDIIMPMRENADPEELIVINRMIEDIVFLKGNFTREEKELLLHKFDYKVTSKNCRELLEPLISTYRKFHDDKDSLGKRIIREIVKGIEKQIGTKKISKEIDQIDKEVPYPVALNKYLKGYSEIPIISNKRDGRSDRYRYFDKHKKESKTKKKRAQQQAIAGECNLCNRNNVYSKCDYCERRFCDKHFNYEDHNCPGLLIKREGSKVLSSNFRTDISSDSKRPLFTVLATIAFLLAIYILYYLFTKPT